MNKIWKCRQERGTKRRHFREALERAADTASLGAACSGPRWQLLLRRQLAVQRQPDHLNAETPTWLRSYAGV